MTPAVRSAADAAALREQRAEARRQAFLLALPRLLVQRADALQQGGLLRLDGAGQVRALGARQPARLLQRSSCFVRHARSP